MRASSGESGRKPKRYSGTTSVKKTQTELDISRLVRVGRPRDRKLPTHTPSTNSPWRTRTRALILSTLAMFIQITHWSQLDDGTPRRSWARRRGSRGSGDERFSATRARRVNSVGQKAPPEKKALASRNIVDARGVHGRRRGREDSPTFNP